jgi:hypothetical protein
MNHEIAINNLIDITTVFEKHNLKYWLQDGTLLGYYREKKIISHDKDTDIGIFFKDLNPAIVLDVLTLGFRIKRAIGKLNDSLEFTFIRDKVRTDIFCYYKKPNDSSIVYHSAYDNDIRIDYEYKSFEVKKVKWFDYEFYVPENELEFITTKYGTDWMTPTTKWSWAYSPLNHVKTDIRFSRDLALKEFKLWLQS